MHAKSPGQENGEGAVPVNSKKNPSRQQNGKQKSNRQRENRGPAKDGAQRVYPEPQNVIDEEDESDLAPPDPVPEPSAEENNTLLSAIRAEINDLEQKVVSLPPSILSFAPLIMMAVYWVSPPPCDLSVRRQQSTLRSRRRRMSVIFKMLA